MTTAANFAMFGWIPFGLTLFFLLPSRKAILCCYMIGWLFLPQAAYWLPGLPDYDRIVAVNSVAFLGLAFTDRGTLLSFKPVLLDSFIAVFCLCPLPTSLANGLGGYDGMSGVIEHVLYWGIPYWIGRAYFRDLNAIRDLAFALFLAGLVYVPFCLYEIRMSPQLHNIVYGYGWRWGGMRLGGYRPSVFMNTGLELGLWMSATSIAGFCLWRSGALRQIYGIPVAWLAVGLLLVTVMCRSLGALALLGLGILALSSVRLVRTKLPLLLLFLGPILYVGARVGFDWYPDTVIRLASDIEEERAESFNFRLEQENHLIAKAWERPVLGWGGHGRNRVYDDAGNDLSTTDGLWILIFGKYGFVGLMSVFALTVVPSVLIWKHIPTEAWMKPMVAPMTAIAVVINLYMIDSLMNAMINPVYHLMFGSVYSLAIGLQQGGAVSRSRSALKLQPQVSAGSQGTPG